jgi:hypothetical protein
LGLRRFGFGGLAGFLKLGEAAAGFVGFTAETDGAAAEAKDTGQRHFGIGGLAEGFEGLEAEANDVGGEGEFCAGAWVVGGEEFGRGLAGGGGVAAGAGEEESGEAEQDGFEDGGGKDAGERHACGPSVRRLFVTNLRGTSVGMQELFLG